MTVPLIFLMISNHFPTATYGASYNWLILSALVLAGAISAKFIYKACSLRCLRARLPNGEETMAPAGIHSQTGATIFICLINRDNRNTCCELLHLRGAVYPNGRNRTARTGH